MRGIMTQHKEPKVYSYNADKRSHREYRLSVTSIMSRTSRDPLTGAIYE